MSKQQVGTPPCTSLQVPLITIHEVPPCSLFSSRSDTYPNDPKFTRETVSIVCQQCRLLSFPAICWANVQFHAHISFQPLSTDFSAFSFVHYLSKHAFFFVQTIGMCNM